MALYKRDGIWWVDIRHQGKRIRKSTGTEIKEDAQRLYDQWKHELWSQAHVKTLPNKTWMDAVVRWINESTHKRSLVTDKIHLAWLDQYLRKQKLFEIDRDLIESIAKKKERSNVSLTTVNRILELIRAILNRAHKEWGWLDSTPPIRMRKIENKRIRWLTKQEANRLLKELPPHLNKMASFTLVTGLRESNVTQLKWGQIDLTKKHALIHADESKSKRPIPVPLSQQAIAILKDQIGKNPTYVFTY